MKSNHNETIKLITESFQKLHDEMYEIPIDILKVEAEQMTLGQFAIEIRNNVINHLRKRMDEILDSYYKDDTHA